jgi:hypothetical protein
VRTGWAFRTPASPLQRLRDDYFAGRDSKVSSDEHRCRAQVEQPDEPRLPGSPGRRQQLRSPKLIGFSPKWAQRSEQYGWND